jgi:glycosyltransferase involved in cell wall biosynthesis
MISVIIPSYRSSKYLDLCLHSLFEGQSSSNEVIVIIDGFVEESKWVVEKYKGRVGFLEFEENKGMQTGLNFGVYNATSDKILIVNDDNVFPDEWDLILEDEYEESIIVTPNQIEPTGPGMFNFPVKDFGRTESEFRFDDYIQWEKTIRKNESTLDGEIFPFLISKKNYMMVGGFDALYHSPFICDWDFFLKLELVGLNFKRSHRLHFYHFGSKATKNRDDHQNEESKFKVGEQEAYDIFLYKWGFVPQNGINNSKKTQGKLKGINYE